jgi:hypothetical protein
LTCRFELHSFLEQRVLIHQALTCIGLPTETIINKMRVPNVAFYGLGLLSACQTALGASWTFADATLTVQGKGSGVGGGLKEK